MADARRHSVKEVVRSRLLLRTDGAPHPPRPPREYRDSPIELLLNSLADCFGRRREAKVEAAVAKEAVAVAQRLASERADVGRGRGDGTAEGGGGAGEGLGVAEAWNPELLRRCKNAGEEEPLPACFAKYVTDFLRMKLLSGNGADWMADCAAAGMSVVDGTLTLDQLFAKAEAFFAEPSSTATSAYCKGSYKDGLYYGENPRLSSLAKGKCDNDLGPNVRIRGVSGVKKITLNGLHFELVVTNGIPSHCYNVGADFPNPNGACEQFRALLRPLFSHKMSAAYLPYYAQWYPGLDFVYKENGMGAVGIASSGAFLFNHKSAEAHCDAAAISEKPNIDACDGHANGQQMYHYHQVPNCIAGFDNCGLLGWEKDGTPTYGFCTVDGIPMKSCYAKRLDSNGCATSMFIYKDEWAALDPEERALYTDISDCTLDKANGFAFPRTMLGSDGVTEFAGGSYAYFFTEEYPYIMPGTEGRYDAAAPFWCMINPAI